MSNLLWSAYLEDDVDRCRSLLGNGAQTFQYTTKGQGPSYGQSGSLGAIGGSPGAGFGTSPRNAVKGKKPLGYVGNTGGKSQGNSLTKADINSRDSSGLTILHRAVSSNSESSLQITLALIEHPLIDLYVQDRENGWTAFHRALYFGNASVARALLQKDSDDSYRQGVGIPISRGGSLVRIKDHEGNSAFDVYNSTIAGRTLQHRNHPVEASIEVEETDDEGSIHGGMQDNEIRGCNSLDGDEFYAFGSNKNLTLGFGDQDDRQNPELIKLKRPDHLIWRFHQEHLESQADERQFSKALDPTCISELPILIKNKPIVIQDAILSKLHSAILTTDPESNLYMCGFGPGGRLGLGDELTRFNYVCVEGGALERKKVAAIALGQNHSIAVTSEGDVVTWGTNTWGTLGYTLPRPANNEEPVNNTPRQIFGPLKREIVIGVAASSIHSVAHTSTSIYTWGKNEGQLGLMDSDSRSLEFQAIPRKVAASLFASPIQMVSAINRATTCLLANHTVCVFTNYGYSIIKFPLYGGFNNYHLKTTALTTRYEAEPSHIASVTSGGETIAAVSSRGDLFTLNVSQNLDSSSSASSTTNPVKIRSSLSQPQRIWSLRKGNWDGIRSVGVGENGSVILCTKAGAVWRRIKRPKVKQAFSSGIKNKDYKFQRVPGLTNVVAVRSNAFGGYSAIRKDCDVMAQILVEKQTLWDDIAPLFCLTDLKTSLLSSEATGKDNFSSWTPAIQREHFDPIKQAVLWSPDLEADVARHIYNKGIGHENYNAEISSSLSETSIPVHSFMLAARSPFMRDALCKAKENGEYILPDVVAIHIEGDLIKVEFQCLDFITIFNLVLYMYTDTVVDTWHFTRHAPSSGHRYRQIRIELMKLAAKLGMSKLETAVRLMTVPEPRMNVDFVSALDDPAFFYDGDTIVELDGGEAIVHSSLMRQRCPFFEGLFGGRAGGQWLAGRRENAEPVRIDLSHIQPSIFDHVLRFIYSDAGTELFDDVVVQDIDEFCDLVMDVLGVANELMLDRLSQVCQHALGRFVNTRNICHLLNDIAPCAVSEFKDAGLEYVCLQLETMLDNHLLDDLDEDLIGELDQVVRENQLACMPFVKSGRAELILHERHPSLAGDIGEERRRWLRDMTFRLNLRDNEGRFASPLRTQIGSLGHDITPSPAAERASKVYKAKAHRNASASPSIRPNYSIPDLMFNMEDDEYLPLNAHSPLLQPPRLSSSPASVPTTPLSALVFRGKGKKILLVADDSPIPGTSRESTTPLVGSEDGNIPWSSPILPSTRLDMREIMSQTSTTRKSSLSTGISALKEKDEAALRAAVPKLTQKERKKQQQQALQQAQLVEKTVENTRTSGPWQVVSAGPRVNLNDVITANVKTPPTKAPTLQVPNGPRPRAASPDTRFSGQQRRSDSSPDSKSSQFIRPSPNPQARKSSPLTPHSTSYPTASSRAEPTLQLSMTDIIGQQKREQDLIKEAVAKRSLQEIQEEQVFQEWWDQESRRAQEEEARRSEASASRGGKDASKGRGRKGGGGGRGRGGAVQGAGGSGRGRGRGQAVQEQVSKANNKGSSVV